ncbi:MAG: DUF1573 domain-containing protein [Planctomycetaceae bacterium]|jgi:hypothetical protein|nr:DUF1573 domain-containing protein [Planctomycetaceae bacterium]
MNRNYFKWLVLAIVFVSTNNILHGDETGIDLIVRAYENSTNIRTCYVEYSLIAFNPVSDSKYQEEAAKRRESLLKALEGHKNPEKLLTNLEKSFRENQLKPRKIKGSYLFSVGNDNRNRTKFNLFYHDLSSEQWSLPTTVLSESGPNRTVSVTFDESGKSIWILNIPGIIADFSQMGRFQGNLNEIGIMNQFDSKEEIKKIIKQLDCKNVGTEIYDTDAQATIVEIQNKNKMIHRYWIDPSKGFICPRVQFYHNDILIEEYQSKDFILHKKTGLWFPTSHQIVRYDNDSNLIYKQEYSINKESIKINQTVSEHEFSIDVPEGFFIDDKRSDTLFRYKTIDRGELSLVKSGLDLDKFSWLYRIIPSYDYHNDTLSTGGVSGVVRIILIVIGIVLILLGLFLKIRKWGVPILLLAFITVSGCSQNSVHDSAISVTPLTLDFGKVRATDSPVQTQFTLRNNGTKPVTILDITSGCGCTIIEPPQKTLPAGTEISVPIRINVWGRYGNFKNTVQIKTDIHNEPIQLAITGEIVTDIWLSSQSLRCTAAARQSAMAMFELHTVDYPNITFDFSKIDDNITVKELSRTTEDGETIIKFNVAVEMEDKDIITRSLNIIPTNPNIAPLIIPIYCYRENELIASPPAPQTKHIALGTVYANKPHEIFVYGDSDWVGVIKQVSFQGSPDNISVQIKTSEETNALHLVFQFPDYDNTKAIEGNIKFITAGKREFLLPVSGLLRQNNDIYQQTVNINNIVE